MLGGKKNKKNESVNQSLKLLFLVCMWDIRCKGMLWYLNKTFRIISVMFIVICGSTVPSGCFYARTSKRCKALPASPYSLGSATSWLMMNNPQKHYMVHSTHSVRCSRTEFCSYSSRGNYTVLGIVIMFLSNCM